MMNDQIPEWLKDYNKRDASLILFAIRNAESFREIAPNHPLTIHCLELKEMVENALETDPKDSDRAW